MSTYQDRIANLNSRRDLRATLASIRYRIDAMLAARRTRKLLAELDSHILKDIGIGRGDAIVEANRPMWDLNWYR